MADAKTKIIENVVRTIHKIAEQDDYTEDMRKFYDVWCETFEDDARNAGVENNLGPNRCAQALAKVVTDKSAPIVDCAAGTGRVGQELAALGYTNIDAVDFSQKSLDMSASKGVYRRLICDKLGTNKVKGINDGDYTGLVCRAALDIGHLTHDVFPEFNRMVKKGGFLVFSVSWTLLPDGPPKHAETLDAIHRGVDRLIEDGTWKLVGKSRGHYTMGCDGDLYTVCRI